MEALSTKKPSAAATYTFAFIYVIALAFLGNEIGREESLWLITTFAISFFAYLWIVRLCDFNFTTLLGIGLLVRIALFFSLPSLSDDFYRFIWDGTLLDAGVDPYSLLPSEAVTLGIAGLDEAFLQLLNSPNYYTVYPPLNQAVFWLSVQFGGTEQVLASVNIIRSILLLADIASLYLLIQIAKKIGNPKVLSLPFWYFLNPLVVLEFTGNLHFEGLVIAFMLLGIHAFQRNQYLGQIIGLGLGIATKLIPMIMLPAFLFRQWFRKGTIISTGAMLVALIFFAPLFGSALFAGMRTSLGLYFQNFEFNASIYYILREIGFMIRGFNLIQTIGPWLGVSMFVLITAWAIYGAYRKFHIQHILLFSMLIYWLLSTTVHPWYIISMVPLGLLAGYYFPLVWSFMIFLTYAGYSEDGFQLSMAWVALEYIVVLGFFIFELYKHRQNART